jgi:hypothetical protein
LLITQSFYCCSAQLFSIKQGHSFAKWLSRADGALTHLHGASAQPFYDFAKSFFIATLLSHFSLLIAQSFSITTVLSHFSLSRVILLQNS